MNTVHLIRALAGLALLAGAQGAAADSAAPEPADLVLMHGHVKTPAGWARRWQFAPA